jgi:S-adenosylmethionine hydrolase
MLNLKLPIFLVSLLATISFAAESTDPLDGTIVEVGYGYGNLQTDIPVSSFAIEIGETFTFSCRDRSFTSTWVSRYSDVPEGSWLGLTGAGDRIQIAISFGDANAESGCGEGDQVKITSGAE